MKCWRASSVVGTVTATCLPAITARNAARSATSVLPKPTSPQISRSIGRPSARSSKTEVDRRLLVFRLLVGEARRKLVVGAFRRRQHRRALGRPRRGDLHQRRRHVAEALLHARLARLPRHAAELVELDVGAFRAVARQKLDVLDRQEDPRALGVGQFEAVVRRAGRGHRLQPVEAGDAVVDVDDEIAFGERGRVGDEVRRAALGVRAHQPVAENVLFADEARSRRSRTPLRGRRPPASRRAGVERRRLAPVRDRLHRRSGRGRPAPAPCGRASLRSSRRRRRACPPSASRGDGRSPRRRR